ncbi:MmcQ/YjbR family DNA-binding protein [Micromonospora sp. NPDC051006]|uniref:MmcQ/YjbR family DNA-binding protein n=1 Tax=Micromonospora sp. NPDC051006 TaxID=3364283 RepID=UPI00378EA9F8
MQLLDRVRASCLALPEVTERPSHGSPTWFVGAKSVFVTLHADGHHRNGFAHLWCAAPPGAQEELILADPARFFRPPYVGSRGWLGVRLDGEVDWAEIDELCRDAYREVARNGWRPCSTPSRPDPPAERHAPRHQPADLRKQAIGRG